MDSCTTCKVWIQERETALKDCNSVFEAVARVHFFELQCEKHCMFNKELQGEQNKPS